MGMNTEDGPQLTTQDSTVAVDQADGAATDTPDEVAGETATSDENAGETANDWPRTTVVVDVRRAYDLDSEN